MPGDPVVGSTVLRRPAIQSPNYVAAVSGWTINADGSAEFNNLTIRGTFNGTDFIINSTGAFFYTGTPALGNLSVSLVPGNSPVPDPEGNTAEAGLAAYVTTGGKTYALQLGAQNVEGVVAPAFWIANLTSPGFEPPAYTATQSGAAGSGCEIYSGKSVSTSTPAVVAVQDSTESGVGNGEIDLIAGLVTTLSALQVGGALTAASLSSGGASSTSTNGLPNGGITGTSGGASAGTAHTHGPGSFSVSNGQHHHTI